MGSKGNSPSPPDPYQTAAAQQQFGENTAQFNAALNRVNTSGPTSSTSYRITGTDPQTGAPIYSQNTSLSAPENQLLQGAQAGQLGEQGNFQGLNQQLSDVIGSGQPQTPGIQYGVSGAGVPGIIDPTQASQQGTAAVLAAEQAAMKPILEDTTGAENSLLQNSGAHPGDTGYERAQDAMTARLAGVGAQEGGTAATAGAQIGNTLYGESANSNQQKFGQNATNAGLNNSGISQALQNYATRTGIPMSLLSQLYQHTSPQVPNAPGIAQSAAQAPNFEGNAYSSYNGQVNQAASQNASKNALLGDATSLGGAGILALSDERMKKDIEPTGKTPGGVPTYLFRYKGEKGDAPKTHGVMAQELEKFNPGAVGTDRKGVKYVDYSQVH